tara:strand:- start:153 stop:455 length:303 start_codon:yes stop_codon:yes gene_type:complete
METRNDLDYANSQPNENEERFENQQDYYERISQAKDMLTEAGYYIGNLYHVDDVKTYFDCTDDEAMEVLDSALDNDGTSETIWMAIRDIGDMMGLKEQED